MGLARVKNWLKFTPQYMAAKTDAQRDQVMHKFEAANAGIEPSDGIHHEIFPDDEPVNGRYRWMARTYDKDGTPHQMTGSEESPAQSVQAAIAWSESKKADLRGKA